MDTLKTPHFPEKEREEEMAMASRLRARVVLSIWEWSNVRSLLRLSLNRGFSSSSIPSHLEASDLFLFPILIPNFCSAFNGSKSLKLCSILEFDEINMTTSRNKTTYPIFLTP